MKKLHPAILLLFGVISSGIAQTNSEFPKLHLTEIIQGSESDIGFWGDGKVYVIELWGTWCAPCIKNIPKLTALQRKYASRGLIVIGYSWEDPGKVRKLLNKMGGSMQYTLVNDQDEKFLKIVAEEKEMVESFPFSFVIGREGNLLWSGNPENGLESLLDDYFDRN